MQHPNPALQCIILHALLEPYTVAYNHSSETIKEDHTYIDTKHIPLQTTFDRWKNPKPPIDLTSSGEERLLPPHTRCGTAALYHEHYTIVMRQNHRS